MTENLPIVVLAGLLFATAAVVAIFYARFRGKPQAVWARRIHERMRELYSRLDLLRNPPRNQRSPAEQLRDELFDDQKRGVPVESLARYRNIGPKTVETLQASGIRNLPQAETHANAFLFKKKIQNVGEAREEAIASAVAQLLIDERQRFDSAATPQGAEYQRRLAGLSAQERDAAAAKAREIAALQACLERTRPLDDLAHEVTFVNSILGRTPPSLTEEKMAAALPEVEIAPAPPSPPPSPSPPPTVTEAPRELPGVARLQAYCRFALLTAKSDGRIAQAERGVIRATLGDQFGSDPLLLRHLDPQLEAAEANLPVEADAIQAVQLLAPRGEWPKLFSFAERIADAMGDRTEKEKQFLTRLAAALEITASPTPPPPPPPATSAHEALGIPEKAEITVELVRRKYTMLWEQVCPEKAATLGPEFAKLAEAKRAAIRAAAEELLAPLGAPLEAPAAPPPPKDLRHNPQLDDLFGV